MPQSPDISEAKVVAWVEEGWHNRRVQPTEILEGNPQTLIDDISVQFLDGQVFLMLGDQEFDFDDILFQRCHSHVQYDGETNTLTAPYEELEKEYIDKEGRMTKVFFVTVGELRIFVELAKSADYVYRSLASAIMHSDDELWM